MHNPRRVCCVEELVAAGFPLPTAESLPDCIQPSFHLQKRRIFQRAPPATLVPGATGADVFAHHHVAHMPPGWLPLCRYHVAMEPFKLLSALLACGDLHIMDRIVIHLARSVRRGGACIAHEAVFRTDHLLMQVFARELLSLPLEDLVYCYLHNRFRAFGFFAAALLTDEQTPYQYYHNGAVEQLTLFPLAYQGTRLVVARTNRPVALTEEAMERFTTFWVVLMRWVLVHEHPGLFRTLAYTCQTSNYVARALLQPMTCSRCETTPHSMTCSTDGPFMHCPPYWEFVRYSGLLLAVPEEMEEIPPSPRLAYWRHWHGEGDLVHLYGLANVGLSVSELTAQAMFEATMTRKCRQMWAIV